MSGIYIKDMEFPKEFNPDNYIELGYGIDGKEYARLYNFHYGGLTEWCEIVQVPPHGDLIDRGQLIDIALHLMNTAKNDDIANGVKWLWQYVIDAQTIIPAEKEGE